MTTKVICLLRANHRAPLSTNPAEWGKYQERQATETKPYKSLVSVPQEYRKLRIRLLRSQSDKEEAMRKLGEQELERQANNLGLCD